MVSIIVCLQLFSILIAVTEGQNVSINTPAGTFIGFTKNVTVDGATVELSKFLGIPYADPPVGKLRFKKPVRKAVLTEPLVVHEHGMECIQVPGLIAPGSPTAEDCLFLNIYAPTDDSSGPLAVMIWVHGGGYVAGSANSYVSDLLAARGNVIVVTINYRLSILGFLNLGDNRPSNFGLWDQHLAIRWVSDNIEYFGGDKGRITIFGESAGSGSVIYQGLYPGNKDLFHRIIAESGSASSPWSESLDPLSEAKEFAAIVGCDNGTKDEILECLTGVPAQVVSDTLSNVRNNFLRYPIPFVPSVDNDFVNVSPRDILNGNINVASIERNVFASFNLMMGSNSGEGIATINPLFGVQDDMNSFLPNRTYFENTLVPLCVQLNRLKGDPDLLTKLIISTYTSWDDPDNPENIREHYIDMHSDISYHVPGLQTMGVHSQYSRLGAYLYFFAAVPSTHLSPIPNWTQRANHGDELQYVFGEVNKLNDWANTGTFQDWEKELSKNIMIMWSNFAKTGNPNQPRDIGVNWERFTQTRHAYLEIGNTLNETMSKEDLIEGRAYTWNHLLPQVNEALARASKSCNDEISGSSSVSHHYIWFVTLSILIYTVLEKCSSPFN